MNDRRPAASIQQQADLLDYLIQRCTCLDGSTAAETIMTLEAGEVHDLRAIADRLHRMAPHEGQIRRLVTGR
jgi:hypothetical protein